MEYKTIEQIDENFLKDLETILNLATNTIKRTQKLAQQKGTKWAINRYYIDLLCNYNSLCTLTDLLLIYISRENLDPKKAERLNEMISNKKTILFNLLYELE